MIQFILFSIDYIWYYLKGIWCRLFNFKNLAAVQKASLSADIFLNKLNNKHITNLFQEIGHSLPSEYRPAYGKTAVELERDKIFQVKTAFDEKNIFLIVD